MSEPFVADETLVRMVWLTGNPPLGATIEQANEALGNIIDSARRYEALAKVASELDRVYSEVGHDLIKRGEALLVEERQTEARFDVFTGYAVTRLRSALGYPDSEYVCGASHCDDPACAVHGAETS